MREGNEGSKALAKCLLVTSNSKHIADIRHHFLRNLGSKRDITIANVASKERYGNINDPIRKMNFFLTSKNSAVSTSAVKRDNVEHESVDSQNARKNGRSE